MGDLCENPGFMFHAALSRRQILHCKLLKNQRLRRRTSWNRDICKAVTQSTKSRSAFGTETFELRVVIGFVHKLFTAVVVSLAGRAGAWEPRKLVSRLIPKTG